MPQIVQFIHPGPEHTKKTGVEWNYRIGHRRKFVQITGKSIDKRSNLQSGKIDFWCEWEAHSKIIRSANQKAHLPGILFEPYLDLSYTEARDNTDPFVFGDQFYYCVCKQSYKTMKELENGSLIVFGSCIDNEFCIDTVFIVKSYTEYSRKKYEFLLEKTNSQYFHASIKPLFDKGGTDEAKYEEIISENTCEVSFDSSEKCYNAAGENNFRSYEGLMYSDSKEIFSFVPCNDSSITEGFERPSLKGLDEFFNPKLQQSLKIAKNVSTERIKEVWEEIRKQVLSQGLRLMVKTDLPEIRNN